MLIVTCPHCSSSAPVPPDLPEVFVCPHCTAKLKLIYHPVPSAVSRFAARVRSTYSSAASSVKSFVQEHPKTTAAIAAAGGFLLYYFSHADCPDEALLPSTDEALPASLPEEKSPSSEIEELSDGSSQESESYADDDTDEDSYVGLCGYCYNCGSPLAGGFYTSPWEDDDNEYGYWNCPCCNAINIDWDSGDD